MATQCFLRAAASADIHRGDRTARLDGTTVNSGWLANLLSLSRGSSAVASATQATVTGPTNGIEIGALASSPLEWISPPLDRDVTISGTITLNAWAAESNMSANVSAQVVIQRLDHTGAIISTILNSSRNVEMAIAASPTGSVNNWTASPTSTAMNKGDRLRVILAGNDAVSDTTLMASGFTFFFTYSGPTGAAQGDTYVTFTENFLFLAVPTAQTLYLTDTAGPAVGANIEREIWTSRGGGVQTDVTNTATGPTAGIQVTDTAGGTAVEWYTKQLQATTLAGAVQTNIRGLESNIAANASIRAEIAICNSDGTGAVVWASAALMRSTDFGELSTTEAVLTGLLAGNDVAVVNGQRLRFRIYVEDATDATLVTGHTVTTYYAGTSGGASGDSFITLPITLTEYVPRPSLVYQPTAQRNYLLRR